MLQSTFGTLLKGACAVGGLAAKTALPLGALGLSGSVQQQRTLSHAGKDSYDTIKLMQGCSGRGKAGWSWAPKGSPRKPCALKLTSSPACITRNAEATNTFLKEVRCQWGFSAAVHASMRQALCCALLAMPKPQAC